MKNYTIKTFALSLAVCAVFASCGEKISTSDSKFQVSEETTTFADTDKIIQAGDIQLKNSYKVSDFEMPFEYDELWITAHIADTGEYIFCAGVLKENPEVYDYEHHYYRMSNDLSYSEEINFSRPTETASADYYDEEIYFNNDGTFIVLYTLEDHGGVKLPEVYDESFNYDAYNENCTVSHIMCSYDPNGTLLSSSKIEFPDSFLDQWGDIGIHSVAADNGKLLISTYNGGLYRFSSDGTYKTIIEPKEEDNGSRSFGYEISLISDRDGKILACTIDEEQKQSEDGYYDYEYNISYCEIGEDDKLCEPLYSYSSYYGGGVPMLSGSGDYRLYTYDDTAFYGIDDSGEKTELVNWLDSDMEQMALYPIGNDEYFGIVNNFDQMTGEGTTRTVRVTRRDPSEIANLKIITVDSSFSSEIVNKFNSSQSDYRIKVVPYGDEKSENFNYKDYSQQFKLDIISGNAPDVIGAPTYDTYINLQKKGAFADLYEFIDNDSEISRKSFMANYLRAMENSDGTLCALSQNFDIKTLVTKTEVNDKENWTFDEMISLYDDPPASSSHLYEYDTKEEMLELMLSPMSDLIDYDKAECNFESPEFIKMLEFCNRFVSEVDMPDKMNDPEGHQMFYYNKFMRMKNNEILTEPLEFGLPSSFTMIKYLQGDGSELTFAGFPSNNGKGGKLKPGNLICMNSKCENKQGAWEFIKFCITDEESDINNYEEDSIPVIEKNFDKLIEKDANTHHSASGNEFPSPTKEEQESIKNYILTCDSLECELDEDIYDICLEEAQAYWNGEISSETAAEHIQNRVSILISERN